MQRTHIVLSLVIIFCIGLLCAIPMGLHVRAIDLFKERDELLVLFLGTAGVYALIFLFVWRHESFMYEKYGNPKMKGNWVRIHATPNSSGDINDSKWNSIKKRISFRNKLKESNDLQNEQEDKQNSSVFEHEERQQLELHDRQQYGQSCFEHLSSLSLPQPYLKQQTLGIHQPLTDMTTSTSFVTSNLDRISCVCLCERDNNNGLIKTSQCSIPKDKLFNDSNTDKENEESHCSKLPGNKKNQCNIEINNPQLSRTELSAANLERRRKPHVRTAQTLALVAANFIISYTPYLVYTTMPIQIRQVVLLKDKPH
ncbi:unnamed protein product [Schistosoma margrebowiei]|uniref:Uncharacterized protein n=1 Tax=Schistosoma margrebowiei TaxID=48269 RepID=A0AA85A135_9TREM|nr:unnamed protein product [Schistosoma margrebowiei]